MVFPHGGALSFSSCLYIFFFFPIPSTIFVIPRIRLILHVNSPFLVHILHTHTHTHREREREGEYISIGRIIF